MKAPAFWQSDNWKGRLLVPLSHLYWTFASSRTRRYTPKRLAVPVICIGNNTVGGAGKTPTVIALTEWLRNEGKQPHIISRGYGGRVSEPVRVDPAQHVAAQVGDEPLLLARHAPCWVAPKRIEAARAAIAAGADCIVMDDGMQNPTVEKTITLMVVDGEYAFGNRRMLPAGPCREPVELSLTNADMVLVIGAPSHPDAAALAALHPLVCAASLIPQSPETLTSTRWLAFAGIGRPEKFFASLKHAGASLVGQFAFADHHPYRERELQHLLNHAQQHQAQLITTEKDWLRLDATWRERVTAFPVMLRFDRPEEFSRQMHALLYARCERTPHADA